MAERLKRIGTGTILLPNRPGIAQTAAIVGKKEGEGPLHSEFDAVIEDDLFGEETWEKAESRFHYTAADTCLKKAGATPESVDVTLGGDLLNQIMAASTAAQKLQTPFLGIYGACSTMAETLCIGAMLCDGGYARRALCCASSHFCSAERQYRFPLEYGNQRPPTSQWTVTGAGAALLDTSVCRPICRATHITLGRIVDLAIKDMNNMGAAMAPAACETLATHFCDMGRGFADYDLVVTGDLGYLGRELLIELLHAKKIDVDENKLFDCGCEIFSERQDTHSGGSGCGCAASMLCAHLLPEIAAGRLRRIVFMATGALLSTTTSMQGESVPGVAHAVVIEHRGGKDA